MMFDFIHLDWDKLNSLPEFIALLVIVGGVAGAVYFIINQKKNQATADIDEKTIASYKNALESTRVDLQTQLDHCTAQHEESQTQLNQLNRTIAGLQGEIKTLREIPLSDIAKGIQSIMETNSKILESLQISAVILKEDTKRTADATEAVREIAKEDRGKLTKQSIKNQTVENQVIEGKK